MLKASRPSESTAFRVDAVRVRDFVLVLLSWAMFIVQAAAAVNPHLRFDLGALIVVFIALELELVPGLLMTLVVGYLAGLHSGDTPGMTITSLVLVYLLLRLIVVRVRAPQWPLVLGLGLLSVLASLCFRFGLDQLLGKGELHLSAIQGGMYPNLLGALVLSYPIYRGLRAVKERFKTREDLGRGGAR